MIQFEISSPFSFWKMYSKCFKMLKKNIQFGKGKLINDDILLDFLRVYIGADSEYEWKIGDFDKVLDGNFP